MFHGFDRKACEVDVDGTHHAGETRAWDRDEDGAWSADVAWTPGPGRSTYLERFVAGRIRVSDR